MRNLSNWPWRMQRKGTGRSKPIYCIIIVDILNIESGGHGLILALVTNMVIALKGILDG